MRKKNLANYSTVPLKEWSEITKYYNQNGE